GSLWAVTWPHDRNQVVRFDSQAKPERMLSLSADVVSLAFGTPDTRLEGLLFISHDRPAVTRVGRELPGGTDLTVVDLATMQQAALATGGTRGHMVRTTPDGRVL